MQLVSYPISAGELSSVLAGRVGWGHMGDWPMAVFGWLFMVLIVVLVVVLVWSATRRSETPGRSGRTALDLLDERYARGEIDREDYLERKADMER